MSTYRERREARADRLRGWADSREVKAHTAFAQVSRIADSIPFGQPILVGHHSEGRARSDQRRIDNGMSKGVEHTRKAESMNSRAANIESALNRSIYSDDPDAIEQLEKRVTKLEAQRDQIKVTNAAYRKAHGAELKLLTPYGRSEAMPYPAYHLANLTGNIGTQRKRLGMLRRQALKAISEGE